ncbi:hypothetical protein C2857_007296 [Epichloe festucae Fl1]|uniref:Fungal lipase-type domain-containing protein n=1 Tax=Epichloe festucae (strain Fl1) TaxID=877507 RepID=A0A7S9PUX9_EPIFF|nr:hypothetical protein C2857_007296 [Epichloe festucae Fl1]
MRGIFAIAGSGLLPLHVLAQQPISSAVFDKITRYTAFSAACYDENCATPPFGSQVVKTFNDEGTDAQATLFRDDGAREVVIAFRGTSSPKDLDTDLAFALVPLSVAGANCSNCRVHEGLQTAFNSISGDVSSAIKSELSSNPGFRLVATGHSLGGGLAAIAAVSLAGQGIEVAETYTYGELRNGDAQWAEYASQKLPDSKYYRVTHFNDGVPHVPPSVLGYVHHGPEYFQSKKQGNSAETTLKCSLESKSCSAGQDFGSNPINGAHLTYSNTVIGSALFIPACGAVFP